MRFSATEEQRLIDDSLGRLLERHWEPRRDAQLLSGEVAGGAVWRGMRDMGLLGLVVPEEAGGGGMGAAEVAVLFRRFGRHQLRSPFLGAQIIAATVLAHSPPGSLRQGLLKGSAAGELRAAPAVLEGGTRYDYCKAGMVALPGDEAGHYRLSGRKRIVLEGDSAEYLLVSCRLGADEGELALVALPRDTAGVRATGYAAFDGTALATVTFEDTAFDTAAVVARGDEARNALDAAFALGALAAAAETLGACEGAFERTLDYLRVREQFGTPIARFQALQHRASDLHADIELLRSLVLGAAGALDSEAEQGRGEAFAAMALAVDVGDRVCREAIQMHGAVGMTLELGIGRYLLRVNALSRLLGDEPHNARLYLHAMREENHE